MTILERPGIPTVKVTSGVRLHHMVIADLLSFADEVRRAIDVGLDPQARLVAHNSDAGHLISLSADSEATDPALCGATFCERGGRINARCKIPKGHLSTVHSTTPEEVDP